jgi:hypothetical protein
MRNIWLIALLAAAACGGDSTGPSPAFPAVAGTYNVTGYFDGIPSDAAFFNGTLAVTQVSRQEAALGGTMAVTVNLQGDVFNIGGALQGANVSPSGQLTFTIGDPSGTWTFSAQVQGTALAQGRHTLSDGQESLSGAWSGSRATGTAVRSAATNRIGALFRD